MGHAPAGRTLLPTATLLLTTLLAACAGIAQRAAAPQAGVQQIGAMREVMRDGKTQGRVHLAALDLRPGTVGVGALAGLAGEVTILDDAIYLAVPQAGGLRSVRDASGYDATFLTLALPAAGTTAGWHGTVDTALDEQTLQSWLTAHAAAAHVDTGKPQPVVVHGVVDELALHAVRGFCPHSDTDPEHQPWRTTVPRGTEVRIVGFLAIGQEGVMTHMGTAFHLHAIVSGEPAVSGHVDHFRLQPGAEVRLGTAP
jgi:hypothetical protein